MSGSETTPDQTIASEYVETAMRGRLDDLAGLFEATDSPTTMDPETLGALEVGAEFEDGYLVDERDTRERAQDRLDSLPLCVDTTTTFEIVLGTGGPDDRLLIECSPIPFDGEGFGGIKGWEIDRVLYRYSWSGSAEIELYGEDRAVAERFARQVVPELVE